MDKLISVIIPIYNSEKYMASCIESVINQTYKEIEIILVDDGSVDNSPKICDDFAQKDKRIKVIHKQNGGAASARNAGLETATGEYIEFVDSDDIITSNMIEVLYNLLTTNDVDLSCSSFYLEEDGKTVAQCKQTKEVSVYSTEEFLQGIVSMKNGYGYLWNKLYKKSLIGDIRFLTSDGCSEDICFNYRYIKNCNKIAYMDICMYTYIRRENSITKGEFCDNAFSIVKATKSFCEELENNPRVYPYCVKGYTDAAFTVLSGVITSKKCVERYDELRDGLLSYKERILHGGYHSKKDKIKIILLGFSKKLYNYIICKVRGV